MEEQNKSPRTKVTKSSALSMEQKAKAAVDKFVDQHLRNSDFSLDTPAWNHFQAGIPVLIGAIVSEMEE